MDRNTFEKGFIVVVPEEDCIIRDEPDISRYIYRFIVSKPCAELIKEIHDILSSRTVFGIITRGSLARFLFEQEIGTPIYQLENNLTNIIDQLNLCQDLGYHKVAMVEIANEPGGTFSSDRARIDFGDMFFDYRKISDTSTLEGTINELKEEGTDCIIGDVEPRIIAEEKGIPNMIVPIDRVCYKNTITKAILSTNLTLIEQSKNSFIEDITSLVGEAVILFHKDGTIERYNQAAEKNFFVQKKWNNISDLLDLEVEEILQMPANSVFDIQDKKSVANLIPLISEDSELFALIINNTNRIEDIEMSIRMNSKKNGLVAKTKFEDMICIDQKTSDLVTRAKKYAKSNATIMICGETGSGKEAFASSIHNASMRAGGPFVAINCATFAESLMESELFGYEKGTFTGALTTGKKGLFELAHKGTLFLDEIAELPLSVQSKLLRALEEREIRRIGGETNIPVDVRILAASNKSLCRQVEMGEFREDLYYRLNVLELIIPPLKERPGDIIPLFKSFLYEFARQEDNAIYWKDDSVFSPLLSYGWPGNVRELRNFAERVVLLADSYRLTEEYLKKMVSQLSESGPFKSEKKSGPASVSLPVSSSLKDLEAEYIRQILDYFNQDREKVCDFLGISKTTLWRKLGSRREDT
ncbi:MAG: sigma 54-interacting transcriptional regulator [Emergencia sp.]